MNAHLKSKDLKIIRTNNTDKLTDYIDRDEAATTEENLINKKEEV